MTFSDQYRYQCFENFQADNDNRYNNLITFGAKILSLVFIQLGTKSFTNLPLDRLQQTQVILCKEKARAIVLSLKYEQLKVIALS